ncbi:GNAT family N-acetyltransferase [Streptomyces sparsus]
MTRLVIRALQEHEARDVFTSMPDPALVGRPLLGRAYDTLAAGGEYRPDWTWVATRARADGRQAVVARAAFWAAPDDDVPVVLDWFDCVDRESGARLLREIPMRHEFELVLPPGWRADAAVRRAAELRIDAAADAGYRPLTERFRYLWTPDCGLPARPGRLVFRPEPDDAVILEVLERIVRGSLDAHQRYTARTEGSRQAAREELDFFHWCPSPREWWRLAYTPAGELVGIQVPLHNPGGPCVGFIGVVPEQRGHGFAHDLLVECTRQLAESGAERIAAATDVGNTPMAAAFAQAGYPIVQHRYCMVP